MMMKIWLIDDDPIFNLINKRLLIKYRPEWEIHSYTEAQKAVQDLEFNPSVQPDIIFLDINMPEMDGWEFLEEVTKKELLSKEDCMVLMHTSSIDTNDFDKAQQYKLVKEYTLKPMEWEVLQDIFLKYNMNV
jgi:CheY-like chemotaxis protein